MSKKSWLCLSFLLLFLVTIFLVLHTDGGRGFSAEAALTPAAQDKCWNPSADIHLTGKTCGKAQDLQLSCYLPADMQRPGLPPDFNVMQRSADVFSWQEFMALNWPAQTGERGEPDPNKKISDPGPRVWKHGKRSMRFT